MYKILWIGAWMVHKYLLRSDSYRNASSNNDIKGINEIISYSITRLNIGDDLFIEKELLCKGNNPLRKFSGFLIMYRSKKW